MKDTPRMIASALIAAILFLLLFLCLHWNLIVCILLCVGVYFGLFFLLKPNRRIAGIDVESMPGGEEIQKLLDDAQTDLADIDKAVKAIADPAVQHNAQALYATGQESLLTSRKTQTKSSLHAVSLPIIWIRLPSFWHVMWIFKIRDSIRRRLWKSFVKPPNPCRC